MKQLSAKVFYSPVKNPEKIEEMRVEDDLEIVDSSVEHIIHEKTEKSFPENNIVEKKFIDFMKKNLKVDREDVKKFFEFISKHLYGRAREPQKYLALIVTKKYSFIYHFKLEEAISFEENRIRKFMKYLDSPNLLKFIYRSVDGYFKIYDKYNTKGWKKLLGLEPEYEAKGNVKVRINRSGKTDVVVETYVDDLENIKDSIKFRWEDKKADIQISDAKIAEVIIYGKKLDPRDVPKKIKYERLGIGKFMAEYKHQPERGKIEESKERVNEIRKPEERLNGKEETFFILGSNREGEELIETMKNEMKNVFNLGFVELNDFNSEYETIKIGNFEIFGKIKSNAKIKEVESYFNKIISETKKYSKLAKLVCYIGLLTSCQFLKSEGFKNKMQRAVEENLKEHLSRLDESIELREIDKLCIEFKAKGFFENSAKKFSKKLKENFEKKNNKICTYFIGVNEDTGTFTPIPLSRMRNEYREELKKNLEDQGIKVLLVEKIPISEKGGILIIVLYKIRII